MPLTCYFTSVPSQAAEDPRLTTHPAYGKIFTGRNGSIKRDGNYLHGYHTLLSIADRASLSEVRGERNLTCADFDGQPVYVEVYYERKPVECFWLVPSEDFDIRTLPEKFLGDCPDPEEQARQAQRDHDADTCTRCGKHKPGKVAPRYSFGVYAGRLCQTCCLTYRDHCGLDQPQGSQRELELDGERIEPLD